MLAISDQCDSADDQKGNQGHPYDRAAVHGQRTEYLALARLIRAIVSASVVLEWYATGMSALSPAQKAARSGADFTTTGGAGLQAARLRANTVKVIGIWRILASIVGVLCGVVRFADQVDVLGLLGR